MNKRFDRIKKLCYLDPAKEYKTRKYIYWLNSSGELVRMDLRYYHRGVLYFGVVERLESEA